MEPLRVYLTPSCNITDLILNILEKRLGACLQESQVYSTKTRKEKEVVINYYSKNKKILSYTLKSYKLKNHTQWVILFYL